ncbi:MAG: AAA family ATPase [Ruminococcus sp.]|nr:AAA family ATPase [Ruminococcus sp.]
MNKIIAVSNQKGGVSETTKSAIRHCDKANMDYIPSDINLGAMRS